MNSSSLYEPAETLLPSRKTTDRTFMILWLTTGLLSNLATLSVVLRRFVRSTNATLFVVSIAIFDTLYLAFKCADVLASHSTYWTRVVTDTAMLASVWLIPLAILDRTAILYLMPLKSFHISLTRKICLVVIPFVSGLFMLTGTATGVCEHFSAAFNCRVNVKPSFLWLTYLFAWFLSLVFIPVLMLKLRKAKKPSQSSFNFSVSSGNIESSQRGSESIELERLTSRYLQAGRKSAKDSIKSTEILSGLLKDPVLCSADPVTSERKRSNIGMRFLINKTKFEHRLFNPKAASATPNNIEDEKARKFKEIQFSRMILAIALLFLLLSLPYLIYEMLKYHLLSKEALRSGIFLRICLSLIDINHSFKFFGYYLASRRFRTELRKAINTLRNVKLSFLKNKNNNTEITDDGRCNASSALSQPQ